MRAHDVRITLPDWVDAFVPWDRPHESPDARMALAIALARENVARGTGGPFGAVVFDNDTRHPVAVGVNLVEDARNAVLHAEIVALMLAQATIGRYTLNAPDLPPHGLTTSCEPCAMCLGAILWSGVQALECGATREDAIRIGFDEGPVFPASYAYLSARGVRVRLGVSRETAAAVLEAYRRTGGTIYNG
ncbi:MAG TPA: nucleoside deaminase [Gemmatimonadales bacterium]|jgi:tRNA(Arg) A34 adenosine deaminase TadA